MTSADPLFKDAIHWGVASRPLGGEVISGDLHLVTSFEGGALIAVIDGLGHGPSAAEASQAAARALLRCPQASAVELMEQCHGALRSTRGAAISLASFDTRTNMMSWIGIGDVEGIVIPSVGPRIGILLRGGVVGYQLPALRATDVPMVKGDIIIFATDGVNCGFTATQPDGRQPRALAHDILLHHGKSSDDALVLVARYQGGQL